MTKKVKLRIYLINLSSFSLSALILHVIIYAEKLISFLNNV